MIRQQITSLRCLFLLTVGAALVLPVSVSVQTDTDFFELISALVGVGLRLVFSLRI